MIKWSCSPICTHTAKRLLKNFQLRRGLAGQIIDIATFAAAVVVIVSRVANEITPTNRILFLCPCDSVCATQFDGCIQSFELSIDMFEELLLLPLNSFLIFSIEKLPTHDKFDGSIEIYVKY